MKDAAQEYNPVTKAIHWTVVALILIMFLTAFAIGAPSDTFAPEVRRAIFTTHKTVGFLVLCVMVFRIFWGHFHVAPPLPSNLPKWQAFAARFVHDGLYALALVTPFIGWALVSMGPYGLKLFGVWTVPPVPYMDFFMGSPDMRTFLSVLHETLATILVGLIIVHIGAAFLHHFVDRDNILLRMSPKCLHGWLNRIRGT